MADNAPEEEKRQIPDPPPEEAGGSHADAAAVNEDKLLSRGMSADELAAEARRKEHAREEDFRDHFERLAICAMYLMFGTLAVFGLVWAVHMILPEKCAPISMRPLGCVCIGRWLTEDQLTIVQDIVTGGLVAGLLADHFRRRMGAH